MLGTKTALKELNGAIRVSDPCPIPTTLYRRVWPLTPALYPLQECLNLPTPAVDPEGVAVSSPLLLATMLMLVAASPVSGSDAETCFSRQHQNAIVNVRQALVRPTTVMDSRVTQSERDCVLACCSEDVKPGIKCTLAVFNPHKPSEPPNNHNCHLFHCQSEQDCPLLTAEQGINTYDIFKESFISANNACYNTTDSNHYYNNTTNNILVTTNSNHYYNNTTNNILATTNSNHYYNNTTSNILATTNSNHYYNNTTSNILVTTNSNHYYNNTTNNILATTNSNHYYNNTTNNILDPDPIRTTEKLQPATEPATTTTTSTGAAATTKSPAAIEPLIPRTTPENELVLVPKGVQAAPASPGTEGQGGGKEVAGRGALKSSLVAVVVVGLAILTLALAVVGRKAMESFDRRHYTRLELNDLHYEV
ncbi:myosin-G heavy chain-like [Oncorhynchus mykiss]|uniref:myosin-G heavy chain-like n=1 Tax=Oncorhynchus mykiss TaxID=8022 RepID=UPI0018787438|nr:myosin-G heavy chain-like [Oncorhynchus mykiss]